jgi:hypothetical protein
MKIKTANRLSLIIDFDDSIIRIQHEGFFDRDEYYSWTTFDASEGVGPDWKSEIITKSELMTRINSVTREFEPNPSNQFAIDIFFK